MKKTFLALLCLCLIACSNKPSERTMAALIEAELLRDGGEQTYAMTNFEKTNGLAKNDQFYSADVRYTLTFKTSFDDLSEQVLNTPSESPFASVAAGFKLMTMRMEYGDFKAGDKADIEDQIDFVKTEQGWQIGQD
ncbi:MAG: hypothetical protein ACI9BO_001759 [Zhongshania sp.]|jgi:hypothetical protein